MVYGTSNGPHNDIGNHSGPYSNPNLRKAALAGISSEAFDPYFRVIEWVVGNMADLGLGGGWV